MPKIRHIAYRADDVEGMATFFVKAFEMTIVQRREIGAIDLSDGTINVTILPAQLARADGQPRRHGVDHIGFMVEDDERVSKLLEDAGAKRMNTLAAGANYEIKFKGPEGIAIDLGHWVGAAPLDDDAGSAKGL